MILLLALLVQAPADLEAKGVKLKKLKDGTITELHVGGKVPLTAEDYVAVGKLGTLLRLNLSSEIKPFDDEAAKSVGGLDKLEHFFSNGSKLSDDGYRNLAGWKSLKHFGLDHWFRPAKDVNIGPGLAHLAALPALESIRLGGCQIGNDAVEALSKIKTLRKLDLFHTFAVTDDGLVHLKQLPVLQSIILGPQFTPRISDGALSHLAEVKSLEEIRITETWLTWEGGLKHLKALPALKKLYFPLVLASDEDIAKLKAELPAVAVEWTKPDDAQSEKLKSAWARRKK
jgi:hypothetical protein